MYLKRELMVEQWLSPTSGDLLKDAVKRQVSSETKERLRPNPSSHIDYGYSFPGLSCTKNECLKDVRDFYEAKGKRAFVADIGAGFGTMTWKLLTAGAEVDAFEIQRPTAEELSRRINNMSPYFWDEDNVEDILHVFPENMLTALANSDFIEKYDFIWISQVLHFLTPDDLETLKVIIQRVLKPGGKVFAEANGIRTFQSLDNDKILRTAYEKSKSKGIAYPGFLTINAATLIDESTNRIAAATIVSVYDQTEMELHHIPIQTNAYGMGYLGAADMGAEVEEKLNLTRRQYPSHKFKINRFHQVMTLMDEDTAKLCFNQPGFECVIYHYEVQTGEKLFTPVDDGANYGLAVVMKKSPGFILEIKPSDRVTHAKHSPLITHTVFAQPPHTQLLLEIERLCSDQDANASFLQAIIDKDYSLALRKACAIGNLPFIKIILKHKRSLDIDINTPSTTSGFTALDWTNAAKKMEPITKERIVSLLRKYGAISGIPEASPLSVSATARQK